MSLRDQGGPGTRDNVEVNDQQSGDTSCLQSVSQEVVSLPGNENADHTEQPNNEQNSSECSQLDHATSWSAEPNVSDTVRYFKIFPLISHIIFNPCYTFCSNDERKNIKIHDNILGL